VKDKCTPAYQIRIVAESDARVNETEAWLSVVHFQRGVSLSHHDVDRASSAK
jgi:hypothetical protein